MRLATLLAGVLLACAASSSTQAGDLGITLTPGSLVRISAPGTWGAQFEGRLESINEEALLVELSYGGRVRVARSAVRQLELSLGPRRHALQGAVWGAAIGAVLGAFPSTDDQASGRCSSRLECSAVTSVGGALTGALIGVLIKSPRWESVPLSRVEPLVTVGERGLAARVRVSF